jgi:hypothetical protein
LLLGGCLKHRILFCVFHWSRHSIFQNALFYLEFLDTHERYRGKTINWTMFLHLPKPSTVGFTIIGSPSHLPLFNRTPLTRSGLHCTQRSFLLYLEAPYIPRYHTYKRECIFLWSGTSLSWIWAHGDLGSTLNRTNKFNAALLLTQLQDNA